MKQTTASRSGRVASTPAAKSIRPSSSTPVLEDTIDLRQLLKALQAVRDGDFSARLPGDRTGIAGKIADTFNAVSYTHLTLPTILRV